jgi:hypothetical protein
MLCGRLRAGQGVGVTGTPVYPVDPSCYPKINSAFMTNAVSPTTPKNQFAVVDSCITFNDALSTTPGDEGFGVLQIALAFDVNRFRPSHKLQQFFGNLFYLANNALLYNNLPAKTKNLQGSQNIVPA